AQPLALAQSTQAPIVHALKGKEHVEWDNPYDVGMTGLIGFSSGYYAMLDCDIPHARNRFSLSAILSAGRREDRPSRSTRRSDRATVEVGVVGDVRTTIEALLPRLKEKCDSSHLDRAREHYRKARQGLDELAVGPAGKPPIHPQQVAKAISDHASSEDAVFTCDVGLPTVWAARYLAMNGKRRLIGSFWHGSMANAMSQAIGAQVASPRRQVISL